MKPDDEREIRTRTRRLVAEWRDVGRFEPRGDSWLRGFDLGFSKAMAAEHLIGVGWPREHGGGGSALARLAVTEEVLRAGAPVAAHWIGDRQVGPAIIRHGSAELRAELLPGILAADFVFCLGMSEPEAGSDLASVRTRAAAVDGGYLINGRKIWTSHAHHATHVYLLARTGVADGAGSEDKRAGLSEFVIDMDSPGITVWPIEDISGEKHFNEVLFEDVLVPVGRLLGTAGNGWRQVVEQLSFERGGAERYLSSYLLLTAVLAAPEQVAGELRGELGFLVARLASLRTLAVRVAQQLDLGRAPAQEAATLKYLGNAFEADVIDFARKAAAMSSVPLDRGQLLGQTLLASPAFGIRGGSSDVLLTMIARAEA